MKVLLDTHIWLWSLLSPARLAPRVARELEDSGNELYLSPISVWEFLMLAEKGRVTVNRDHEEWLREALRLVPVIEAPLTVEVAVASRSIALPHRDPADRFIAATARVFGLTLATADERLFSLKSVHLLKNKTG